jgi:predicted PurR-regulated permease PerM
VSGAVVDPRFQVPPRRVIALLVFAAAVFWFARPVMLPFVVGAIIAYAFSPYIDAVQARTGRSRALIVAALFGAGLLVVAAIVVAFAGPVSREIALLIRSGPDALTTALRRILGADSVTVGDLTVTVEQLAAQLQQAINAYLQTPEGALHAAEQLLKGSLDVILTMLVTFFLLLDGGKFGAAALRFLEPGDRVQMQRVATRVHSVVGQWLRGQLVLVVLLSVVASIVLGPMLRLPNPLALGIMVGLFGVITFIGPIISGAVVAIVALSTGGPVLAGLAVAFLFVLRQLENVLIMPVVLGRAVNLHPLVALFAVVVGSTAFGIVGTFLALPVAAGINVALHEFFPEELGALPGDAAVRDVEATQPAALRAADDTGMPSTARLDPPVQS